MQKKISVILPFLCMFILATGSVVLSCTMTPKATESNRNAKISLNTGVTQEGKLYTTWVFDRIQSVIIVDERDRSRKVELAPNEWKYDPYSTELSILKEIPFNAYFARIEGTQIFPHTFVLNGIKDETELLVIVSDRLAIGGYDYTFNAQESKLTFRNDVKLKDSDWSIQYSTAYGGTMLGEWKPENEDRRSYLEAEHRKRWLDSWYDRQTGFWFLDDSKMEEWKAKPDQAPVLIWRMATPKELADMKSTPVTVLKFRTETKERNLTREIGFDTRIPNKLRMELTHEEFPLAWKTIEEYSQNGSLVRKLDIVYEDGTGKGLSQYVLDITLEKDGSEAYEIKKPEWIINEETVDLGLPVHVVRQWGIQTSNIDAKPTVVSLTTWTWTEGSIRCQANGDSKNEARTVVLLRQFIAARMKTR